MKADRRHELKDNDLAAALGSTRDYLDRHGKQIGMAALAVLAVMAAVTFAMRSRAAAIEDVWRRRGELVFDDFEKGKKSIETLESLTHELSDPAFVMSGLVDLGQRSIRLSQMSPAAPDNELNERARKAFEELRTRYPQNPLAIGSSLLGLASVAENDFVLSGDLKHKDTAKAFLNQVVQEARLNGMPFQATALDRLKTLDETFTKVAVAPAPPPPPPAEPATDAPPTEPPAQP